LLIILKDDLHEKKLPACPTAERGIILIGIAGY